MLADTNNAECFASAGFRFPPDAAPTVQSFTETCATPACGALIKRLEKLAGGECSLGSIKVMGDIVTPYKRACGGDSSSTDKPNSDGSNGGSKDSSSSSDRTNSPNRFKGDGSDELSVDTNKNDDPSKPLAPHTPGRSSNGASNAPSPTPKSNQVVHALHSAGASVRPSALLPLAAATAAALVAHAVL
ncbi:hypothetical protein ATCC90586_011038 [Pythium insidiosum]|nr:hypothetical protein ATCC90586_011038 [Pythium insidiosum]